MDPHTGEILALANWPRVDANDAGRRARLRHAEPRRRLHLRARLDLQGLHGRRRAPGRRRHARHAVRPAAADPGRRPVDRRVARARAGHADDRRRSSRSPRTSARSRSACGSASSASTTGCAASASASRPASTCPARSAASCCRVDEVLGLVDGQPADRPGPGGHADADGARPTRRSPTAASCARRASCAASTASRPSAKGTRVISAQHRGAAAHDARGRLRARRHRERGRRSPATSSRARPARRRRSTRRPASTRRPTTSRRSSASRRRATRSCWSR